MLGAEYLTEDVLAGLWRNIDAAFDIELAETRLSIQEFLKGRHPAWNLVGRNSECPRRRGAVVVLASNVDQQRPPIDQSLRLLGVDP